MHAVTADVDTSSFRSLLAMTALMILMLARAIESCSAPATAPQRLARMILRRKDFSCRENRTTLRNSSPYCLIMSRIRGSPCLAPYPSCGACTRQFQFFNSGNENAVRKIALLDPSAEQGLLQRSTDY